jgi:hypothetical protein
MKRKHFLVALTGAIMLALVPFSCNRANDEYDEPDGGDFTSLDGAWAMESRISGDPLEISISGAVGKFVKFPESGRWTTTRDLGHVKVGDAMLRNIRTKSEAVWDCEALTYQITAWTEEIRGIEWVAATITLQNEGKSFTVRTTAGASAEYDRK